MIKYIPVDPTEKDFFLSPVGTSITVGDMSHKDEVYVRTKAKRLYVGISFKKWTLTKTSQKYQIKVAQWIPKDHIDYLYIVK